MHKVILHGYYSEYSLGALEDPLRKRGFDVFTLTEDKTSLDSYSLKKILQEGCIFISSCHFLGDKKIFCKIYPQLSDIYTPFDIYQMKSSKTKMIYIPHDLAEPIKWCEWPIAYIFDRILLPFYSQIPAQYINKCEVIGWVKNFSAPSEDIPQLQNIFLPTTIVPALKHEGVNGFYKRYKDIFDADISIKLPSWPGLEELTEYLKKMGVSVLPSRLNSFHLIQASTNVITNGIGSIARETAIAGKNLFIYPDRWTTVTEINTFASSSTNCFICSTETKWNNLPKNKKYLKVLPNEDLLIQEINKLITSSEGEFLVDS